MTRWAPGERGTKVQMWHAQAFLWCHPQPGHKGGIDRTMMTHGTSTVERAIKSLPCVAEDMQLAGCSRLVGTRRRIGQGIQDDQVKELLHSNCPPFSQFILIIPSDVLLPDVLDEDISPSRKGQDAETIPPDAQGQFLEVASTFRKPKR